MKRIGTACLVAVLAAAGAWLYAQTPEEVQQRAEEEQRLKESLMSKPALERQKIEQLDLMSKAWQEGSLELLKTLHPDDIVKMQVLGLVEHEGTMKKVRCGRPFGLGSRNELEGLLALIKAAPAYEPHPEEMLSAVPDRALVVQPWQGEPFEIHYDSGFTTPFAGLGSRRLKEALHALSGGQHRITAVRLVGGKVDRVVHTYAIAPHLGGHSTDYVNAELHLTPEQGLTLYLRLHMDLDDWALDEQPMGFGEAKVFKSDRFGTYVVVLDLPDEHWEEVAAD